MSEALRRFRRHPIFSTLGGLYTTALIGMTSLVWLGALGRVAKGQGFPGNELVALTVVSILAGWYLNFMTVYHRLRRLDPQAYAWTTKDMGFIAFMASGRTAPMRLHNALGALDLDRGPASFRFQVRFTRLLNAMLLWACCAGAFAFLAVSIVRKVFS